MTYDLRRLRLHGLIERIPRTNTYTPHPRRASASPSSTPRSTAGSSRPLLDAADQPPAPIELRRALATIDRTIADLHHQRPPRHSRLKTRHKIRGLRPQEIYITDARLGTAA